MNKLLTIIFIYAFTWPTGALFAQENKSDTVISDLQLEPVVVSSSKLPSKETLVPLSISSINKKRLQAAQPQLSIRDALDAVPGVFALNADNYAQDLRVSIRGFGARAAFGIRGVKVLVDGIPESTPDGQAQVDNIDLGVMKDLEVIRGPSSVLYGNASGGVLSFSTETVDNPFAEVRFTAGSYGLQRYQFKTGQKLGKVETLFYGSHTQLNGYRDQSGAKATLLNNKTKIALNESATLKLLLNYNTSPLADDPGGLTLDEVNADRKQARALNVSRGTGEEIEQGRIGVIFDKTLGDKHTFQAKAYHTFRDFTGFIPFSVIEFDRAFSGVGVNYTLETQIGSIDYRLTAGVNFEQQIDDRYNFENNEGVKGQLTVDQQEEFTSTGVYALQELRPTDALKFTMGVRYDAVDLSASDNFLINGNDSGSLTFNQFNPMLGALYEFNPGLIVYSSFATSFETPTLSELSNNPDGLGGFNEQLKPQKARNYEVGVKGWVGNKLNYQATVFHVDVEDELVPYGIQAFPDRDFYRNAGSSDRNGIELGFGYQLSNSFSSYLTYTYSDFVYEDFQVNQGVFDGNRLPGIPEHMLYHELRYSSSRGLFAVLQTRYVGDLYAENSNQTTIDNYTVLNLRAGYSINVGDWVIEPFGGINNILSSEYFTNIRINAFGSRFYEPAPEINFYVGVRVRFLQ